MFKQVIAPYFSYTKKERRGVIVLLLLILLIIILPFLYPLFIKSKPVNTSDFKKEIDRLIITQDSLINNHYINRGLKNDEEYATYNQPSEKNYYKNTTKGELFYFDPNTASADDWKRLGLRDKTISTIQNYLSKGGHFYKPEDISKIWGLHEDEVQRLIPYVQIAAKENNYTKQTYEPKSFDKPKYTPSIIDINTADTTALIALPGIGSKLAQRILNFRDKLGGFYKMEQVGETYGLPDSTFQKIKARLTISNAAIKQFNINTATVDELKSHPYIKYNLANAIAQYRTQHGNFTSVAGIKNIMMVTEDIYSKAAPYLTVE
jgi:competence protein ComEA